MRRGRANSSILGFTFPCSTTKTSSPAAWLPLPTARHAYLYLKRPALACTTLSHYLIVSPPAREYMRDSSEPLLRLLHRNNDRRRLSAGPGYRIRQAFGKPFVRHEGDRLAGHYPQQPRREALPQSRDAFFASNERRRLDEARIFGDFPGSDYLGLRAAV